MPISTQLLFNFGFKELSLNESFFLCWKIILNKRQGFAWRDHRKFWHQLTRPKKVDLCQERRQLPKAGGQVVLWGAQSAPSGWDRVNRPAKTCVGNWPLCPPNSYAPVFLGPPWTPRRIWARQGPIFYPKFFARLFLIRAYWNPKSRQGPGLGGLASRGGPVPNISRSLDFINHDSLQTC